MESSPKQCPSFFKVLVGDYAHKIQIPPAFVYKFNGDVPQNAIIKAKRGKSKWAVKIKEIDERLFVTGHGWEMFVVNNDLKFGNTVIFRLISTVVFEVTIYGLNGCEKVITALEKYQKRQALVPRGRPSLNHKGASTCKLVTRGAKRAGRHRLATGEGSTKRMRTPSFVVVLKKYHKYYLTIPKAFAYAAGIENKKAVLLRTKQGKDWLVHIRWSVHTKNPCGRIDTGAGWRDFWHDNELALKDRCLFKFVPGTSNIIQVKISSAK